MSAEGAARVDALITAIKSKKGLGTLDDAFVREKLERVLRSDATITRKLDAAKSVEQFLRSKEWDAVQKRVRKELRAVYGVFQAGDRGRILAEFLAGKMTETAAVEELLQTHVSTKERQHYYTRIARELAGRITPAPQIVIDLGCGLNPLADAHFRAAGWRVRWIASDVSETDMTFLREAFHAFRIHGETRKIDLLNATAEVGTLAGDVTFLLKLLDSLEESRRHISYALFDRITTPWIVASFPTRSLGGRNRISTAGRTWFERMLTRKKMTWETFQVPNELFYVIRNGRTL